MFYILKNGCTFGGIESKWGMGCFPVVLYAISLDRAVACRYLQEAVIARDNI